MSLDRELEKEIKKAVKEVMKDEMKICRPETAGLLEKIIKTLNGEYPLTVGKVQEIQTAAERINIDLPEINDAIKSLTDGNRSEAVKALLSSAKTITERMKICFIDWKTNSTGKIKRKLTEIEKSVQEIKKALEKN